MLTVTNRRLRQKTTGDVYVWTALLAARDDMEEIDPAILEAQKEESPEDRAKRERAEKIKAKRIAGLDKARAVFVKNKKAETAKKLAQRERNKRIGEARALARQKQKELMSERNGVVGAS